MKVLIVFVLVSVWSTFEAASETYPTDHDDYDIDAVVNNPSQMLQTIQCHIKQGPCNETDDFFNGFITDAVKTACSKCNTKQKYIFKKFVEGLTKYPKEMQIFQQIYDPEGKYFPSLAAALA